MQLLFAVSDSADLIWGSWWSAHPAGHTLGKKGSFMTSKRLKCLNVQENGLACSAFFRADHSTLGSSSVSLYQKSGPSGTRALWASLIPSFCLLGRLQSIGASPTTFLWLSGPCQAREGQSVFSLRYPFCTQTRRLPKGLELQRAAMPSSADTSKVSSAGLQATAQMWTCLSELPEPTGHLCWHTGLRQHSAFLLSATVSFLVRLRWQWNGVESGEARVETEDKVAEEVGRCPQRLSRATSSLGVLTLANHSLREGEHRWLVSNNRDFTHQRHLRQCAWTC